MSRYKDGYNKLHFSGKFPGNSLQDKLISNIKDAVKRTHSHTLLDFGCGKATRYKTEKINRKFLIRDENMYLYDPYNPEFENFPVEKVHGVISTDVLEHIPEEEIPDVLTKIFTTAERFVYLVIDCGLAKTTFEDGTNVHVTIKRPAWWREQIEKYNVNNIPVATQYKIPSYYDSEANILNITMEEILKVQTLVRPKEGTVRWQRK
jgi:hypothetical protein